MNVHGMLSRREGEVAKRQAGSPSLSATTSYLGLADALLASLPRFRHDQQGEIHAFSFPFFSSLAQPSEVLLCSTHWCFGLLVLPAKLCYHDYHVVSPVDLSMVGGSALLLSGSPP